jgi:hypothetical protein
MEHATAVWGSRFKRRLCLLGLIFVAALSLYLLTLSGEFQLQQDLAARFDSRRSSSLMLAWQQSTIVLMKGVGAGAGAAAQLRYGSYDPIAQLHVSDLPVLPPSQFYQLWCYTGADAADASTTFRTVMGDDEPLVVNVAAPNFFGAYSHFAVTIETNPTSVKPSTNVVLSN